MLCTASITARQRIAASTSSVLRYAAPEARCSLGWKARKTGSWLAVSQLCTTACLQEAKTSTHTGSRHERPRTIAVLGGGISGLTSVLNLSRALPQSRIVLIEREQRLGGWIDSRQRRLRLEVDSEKNASATPQTTDGGDVSVLFERGPRSIRPSGLSGMVMLDLLASLNLLKRLLTVPKTAPSARNRFIYYPDRLNQLPSSLTGFLRALASLPVLQGVLAGIMREAFVPSRFARDDAKHDDDESVDSFMTRRFGAPLAQNVLSAVLHGIYAGDSRTLSVRSVMPFLWDAERTHGSVLRALLLPKALNARYRPPKVARVQQQIEEQDKAWLAEIEHNLGQDFVETMKKTSVYSFPGGVAEIVQEIQGELERAPNVQLWIGTSVAALKENGSPDQPSIVLETSQGELECDRVISALPSSTLSRLTSRENSALPHLTHNPSVDVAVINVAIQFTPSQGSSTRILPVQGFGYLVPRTAPHNPDGVLGVVFDSDSLPTQDLREPLASSTPESNDAERPPTKLTVMMGGAHWAHLSPSDLPDQDRIREATLNALETQLGLPRDILRDPSRTHVEVNMQRACIPQYLVGHPARMRELHDALKNNERWRGALTLVGASYTGVSLNDCVTNAARTAQAIVRSERHANVKPSVITGLERFAAE